MQYPLTLFIIFLAGFLAQLNQPVEAGRSVVLISLPSTTDRSGQNMLEGMPPFLRRIYTPALDQLTQQLTNVTDSLRSEGPYALNTRATLFDLYQAVSDPTVDSVLYIGHARPAQAQGALMESPSGIVDWDGFDVSPALQAMHPSLRALAIVGCFSSEGVWKHIRRVYSRSRFPDLHLNVVPVLADAVADTRAATRWIRQVNRLPRSRIKPMLRTPLIRPVHLHIRRILTETARPQPAALIESTTNGRLLGVFPPGDHHAQIQELTIQIPPGQEFRVGSGPSSLYLGSEVEEGDYELSDPRWQPMRNPRTHEITEVFSRLYLWNNP